MKTRKQIQEYRDALERGMDKPCNCKSTGHEDECNSGRIMILDAIATLDWVLGNETQHSQKMRLRVNRIMAEDTMRADTNDRN